MNLNDLNMTSQEPSDGPQGAPYAAVLRSKLLGEDIILLRDRDKLKEIRSQYPGVVVYFPEEIDTLMPLISDPEAIRLVHIAKKQFEGWVY